MNKKLSRAIDFAETSFASWYSAYGNPFPQQCYANLPVQFQPVQSHVYLCPLPQKRHAKFQKP